MAISLKKGQKVDLTKGNPGLSKLLIGLGWDTNKYDGGFDFDLDASAFLLGANEKVTSDADFVFYGNLKHASGGVEHTGDNLTGEGEGDDEQIKVDLSKVPASIDKIEDFSIETAVVVGRLYRQGSEWKFNAIGSGYSGGLGALGKAYGVNV